jgi:hypothetical protein
LPAAVCSSEQQRRRIDKLLSVSGIRSAVVLPWFWKSECTPASVQRAAITQRCDMQHGSLSVTVWRPVRADAAKSGVAAENVSAGLKSGQMSVQEAQQILGVEKNATLEQARKVPCHQQGVPRTLHVVTDGRQGVPRTLAHGC